ncbi:hypothetical protein [Pseudonocardia hierapolitana]|uniref:hypothetical protein n=1 Tax=Pseudonocardia hierapolitana TaxID=1128676 RepID=UPI0011BF134E|nr:hypothetical protein [Pseudonocardia hierapolitana]
MNTFVSKSVRTSVRWAALTVVAAALPLMSACSGSSSAGSASAVAPATAQPTPSAGGQSSPAGLRTAAEITGACPFVETSEVDEAFSISGATGTEAAPQKLANGGQAFVCSYAVGGEDAAALVASVYEGNKVTPDQMIKAILDKKAGAERVGGIGEGAVYYTEDEVATFSAVKVVGGTPVMVAVSGPATADKDRVGVLVKQAVDKL